MNNDLKLDSVSPTKYNNIQEDVVESIIDAPQIFEQEFYENNNIIKNVNDEEEIKLYLDIHGYLNTGGFGHEICVPNNLTMELLDMYIDYENALEARAKCGGDYHERVLDSYIILLKNNIIDTHPLMEELRIGGQKNE